MDERTDGKIEKQDCHDQIDLKVAMFRSRSPAPAQAPESLEKEKCKQGKEHSRHLMPERAACASK